MRGSCKFMKKNYICNLLQDSGSCGEIFYKILNIAIPFSSATIFAVLSDLLCIGIIGSFDAVNYYLVSLFLPFNFLLYAIFECYKTSTIAFASSVFHNKNVLCEKLSNYLILVCILACFSLLFLIFFWLVFNQYIMHLFRFNLSHLLYSKFMLFTTLMFVFACIRVCSICFSGVMYAVGLQKTALYISTIISFIALLFTYVFSCLKLDALLSYAYSIGLASLISLTVMYCNLKQKKMFLFNLCFFKINRKQIFKTISYIYRLGLPVFISYAIVFISLFLFNIILNKFGEQVVSGFGIAYRIQSMLIIPAIGFGVAGGVVINHFLSLNNTVKARKVLLVSIGASVLTFFCIGFLMLCTQKFFISLLISDFYVAKYTYLYFFYVAPTYFAYGANLTMLIIFEQIGKGWVSFLLNVMYFFVITITSISGVLLKMNALIFFKAIGASNLVFFVFLIYYSFVHKNVFSKLCLK